MQFDDTTLSTFAFSPFVLLLQENGKNLNEPPFAFITQDRDIGYNRFCKHHKRLPLS